MINKLRTLILGASSGESVTVKLSRAVRVRLADGGFADGAPGESYNVSRADAHGIESAGAGEIICSGEDLAAIETERAKIEATIPGPVTPEPIPKEVSRLPESFADWWTIREKRRCLAARSEAIGIRFRLEWSAIGDHDHKLEEIDRIPDPGQRRELLDKMMGARVRIMSTDPSRYVRVNRLKDELYRSWTAVADFEESSREPLWKAVIQSGDSVIEMHARLSKLCRELDETGRTIFRTRIASLGLGESDVSRLYANSADAARFSHEHSRLLNLRVAWQEGSETRSYLDLPFDAMATYYTMFVSKIEQLEKIKTQADKELATARKSLALVA